ncbi:hypothetical protein USDA257_c24670 [Sinorhizobium fredii USDA 257]|uniref:Uncharacterized protein n=1 Tax=Sinorhizobium fredii (strain USDA 257) TaxID=1185652 RepID=I3X587_SINF2|nr:hypothetical protein USDA257_c24670 [Sinorhizobium fredii USDA 257]
MALGVGEFQHKDLAYAVDDAIATALANGRIAAKTLNQLTSRCPPIEPLALSVCEPPAHQ